MLDTLSNAVNILRISVCDISVISNRSCNISIKHFNLAHAFPYCKGS